MASTFHSFFSSLTARCLPDIDECKEKLACQCSQCKCKNTWGSYDCRCGGSNLLYIREHDTCISAYEHLSYYLLIGLYRSIPLELCCHYIADHVKSMCFLLARYIVWIKALAWTIIPKEPHIISLVGTFVTGVKYPLDLLCTNHGIQNT